MIYLATPDRFPPGPFRERAQRLALKGLGGGVLYGLVIEPRWLETTWIDFPVPGLPRALDGYRIAHLTDLHHNLVTGRRFLFRVIRRINALHPDLITLTGDYITHRSDRMETVAQWLGRLRAPDGILATLGNHDYRCPVPSIRRFFQNNGIRLLEDEHLVVYPRRLLGSEDGPQSPSFPPTPIQIAIREEGNGANLASPVARSPQNSPWRHRWHRWVRSRGFQDKWKEWQSSPAAYVHLDPAKHPVLHHPRRASDETTPCLCVVGIGDLWEGKCDLATALEGAPDGVFRLLLSHNPEVAHLIGPQDRIGLMLSGHTHGGQTWPFHRAPLREGRSRKYLRGLIRSHATNVYVSRGVGSSALHFRWNCRPEITLNRLLRTEDGHALPPIL